MVGYAALGGRECEIAVANRAGELPGLQSRQENFRLNGDRAPAAFRLWRSDFAVAVRPLPDVDLAGLEVDIAPPEATQLTGSESGQRRRQQQGAPRRSRLLRATIPRANTMTCRTRSITRITRFAAFAKGSADSFGCHYLSVARAMRDGAGRMYAAPSHPIPQSVAAELFYDN